MKVKLRIEHIENIRKELEFEPWAKRMGASAKTKTQLRALLRDAPENVRTFLMPRAVGKKNVFQFDGSDHHWKESMNARANAILASFAPAIQPRSRILDIGAGKGLLAQALVRQFNARVTMVDVASYNQSDLPLTVCDSRALAFASDSFDYAILSFVLHHTCNPDTILREALRVAREVIVIENDVCGPVRQWFTRAIDSWPALRYGTPPCYVAQPRDAWLKLFAQFSVEARVLSEFSLEYGFFRNVTVRLTKRME